MSAIEESKKGQEILLPYDVDLFIQSGPLTEENERLVLAFIKKSKYNRRRRERYAANKASSKGNTPSVSKDIDNTHLHYSHS